MTDKWRLTFSDEFNSDEINTDKWNKIDGHRGIFQSKITQKLEVKHYFYTTGTSRRISFLNFFTPRVRPLNPSVPDAPNWRISVFEKRLHETETSKNVVGSVKRSGVNSSIISWRSDKLHGLSKFKKSKGPNFTNFTLRADCAN